ncbi:MAG TPA: HAMP domain-containing protein [Polyangiaceae bacterium]|nr:HAMP domain-containing protein [Polyangiaceae bacterium]
MKEDRGATSSSSPPAAGAGGSGSTALPLLPRSINPGQRQRFFSIGAKLGVAVVMVVTLASVLAFLFSAARERDALVLAKQQSSDMVADLFAESLRAPLDFGDADAVQVELQHLKQNHDLLFAGVWHAGDPKPMGTLNREQERHRGQVMADLIEVSRQVKGGDGQVIGHAKLQFSLQRENEAYTASRLRLLLLCLAVAIGTVGVLLTVTRTQVVGPVDSLIAAVRQLERGEREVKVAVTHHDEIGRLARGVEAMGSAIRDREDRLAEALGSLRELFDHMRQAIVVFDSTGSVVGAQSNEARKVFGLEVLEGAQIRDLIYPGRGGWDAELKAFDDWLSLVFDARAEDFGELLALAPPEVRLPGPGHDRVLSLEFRPIEGRGVIQRVMLLATDETEKRQLAESMLAQGQSHARQMAAMQRLVAGGGQQFVQFLRGARERLMQALALCHGRTLVSLGDFTECFGHVHTLRGEARVYGLEELAVDLETLEARLSELRAQALARPTDEVKLGSLDIEKSLERAQQLLDEAERLFVAASPIGRAVLEQVTVHRRDLDELCRLSAAQGGQLASLAERLSARSLGELVAPFADRTARWAESVNKRARLEVEGREALVPERLARVLSGTLTHLLRNAVAHGIEAPDERERHGKPAVGVVTVGAAAPPGELATLIYVEDDGVGVEGNPLLERARQREAPLSPEDADSGSFRQAQPTSETELSGRGMGLSAVLRDLAAFDFVLRVGKSASGGARFEIARKAAVSARISA